MNETTEQCVARWDREARSLLVGRTIVAARYMTAEECDLLGWHKRCVVIELDDGTKILPSMDDEGNGAGSLLGPLPKENKVTRDDWDDHPMFPVIERGPTPLEKVMRAAFDKMEDSTDPELFECKWDALLQSYGIKTESVEGWPQAEGYSIPPEVAEKMIVLGELP